MNKQVITASVGASLILFTAVSHAAISAINNNVRIFEDTLWLAAFALMIVSGLLLKRVSGSLTRRGYVLLALAGLSGLIWKSIGLAKRLLLLDEPKWFFSLARETFEGMTGIILACAFIIIAWSVLRLVKRQKSMMRQRRSPGRQIK